MAVTRRIALCLVPFLAAVAAGKKKVKPTAGWSAEMVAFQVRRSGEERLIVIEGRVRNSGTKLIQGLTFVFYILAPSGKEVSRQRGRIDADILEPGEESEFSWKMDDQARAVEVRIQAVDHNGDEIALDKPGPYPID
jgi:hypothetical protein